MKLFITLCCAALLLSTCTKEVGKKPYSLELTFASGEVLPLTVLIYEKAKKYDIEVPIYAKKQTNAIYIESDNSIPWELVMFKDNEERLVGINDVNYWKFSAVDFAGGQEVSAYGVIEMDGLYTKKGRKFTVENGTFTITWANSNEYGIPAPKIITGTWRMERE